MEPSDITTRAISLNLQALSRLLSEASRRSAEASGLCLSGKRDEAIGAVLGVGATLDQAKAVYDAAIVLHRLCAN